jgi:predicted small secreted protein
MARTVLICLTLLALAGCETIKGAARDLQNAGRAVERAL